MKRISSLIAAAVLVLFANSARAIPALQLDIAGGTYDMASETVMAPSNSFALYAYSLNPLSLTDKYFLSMALVPSTITPGSFGSFTVNGTTVDVTADMFAGGPPLESIGGIIDPGDLARHGIFPTFFAEQGFFFSAVDQSDPYNTQESTGSGPQVGTGMYYKRFDFDISGLAPGLGIHFDLYSESLILKCKGKVCTPSDIDINQFAPFSHDAAGQVTVIPEPETYAMLLAGLGLLGFAARRRKLKLAA